MKYLIDEGALDVLLSESDQFAKLVNGYSDKGIAIAEWEDGNHTHIAFEVMAATGEWLPISVVPLAACVGELNRSDLRQFPVFRLAWYGQLGLPSSVPQESTPSQDRLAGALATTPASDLSTRS